MTNLINFKDAVKNDFIKFISIVIAVVLMGYGIVSFATEDTKTASINFSVLGIVSNISDDSLDIEEANGSDKSGKSSYSLNIKNLTTLETNENVPINFIDIKVGDKIIAQGLKNGSTFFIKRIISFTSIPTPVETKDVATSTATSTDYVSATTTQDASGITTETVNTSTTTDVSIPLPTLIDSSTSTETVYNSTTTDISIPLSTLMDSSSSTEILNTSTTTGESTEITNSVIETVTDIIEEIINNVTETVQVVLDKVTDNNDQTTPTEVNQAMSL